MNAQILPAFIDFFWWYKLDSAFVSCPSSLFAGLPSSVNNLHDSVDQAPAAIILTLKLIVKLLSSSFSCLNSAAWPLWFQGPSMAIVTSESLLLSALLIEGNHYQTFQYCHCLSY